MADFQIILWKSQKYLFDFFEDLNSSGLSQFFDDFVINFGLKMTELYSHFKIPTFYQCGKLLRTDPKLKFSYYFPVTEEFFILVQFGAETTVEYFQRKKVIR